MPNVSKSLNHSAIALEVERIKAMHSQPKVKKHRMEYDIKYAGEPGSEKREEYNSRIRKHRKIKLCADILNRNVGA